MLFFVCLVLGSIPSTSESDATLPFKKRKFLDYYQDKSTSAVPPVIHYSYTFSNEIFSNNVLSKSKRFLEILDVVKPEIIQPGNDTQKLNISVRNSKFHILIKKYIEKKLDWYFNIKIETLFSYNERIFKESLTPEILKFVKMLLNYNGVYKECKKDEFINFIEKSKDIRHPSYKSKIYFSHIKFQELFSAFLMKCTNKDFYIRSFINTELKKFKYFNIFPEILSIDMQYNLRNIDLNKVLKIYIWLLIINELSEEIKDKIEEIRRSKINIIDFESHEVFSNLYICFINLIYILYEPTKDTGIFKTKRPLGDILTNVFVVHLNHPNKGCRTNLLMSINKFENAICKYSSLSFKLLITFHMIIFNNFLSQIPRGNSSKELKDSLDIFQERIDFYVVNYHNFNRKDVLKAFRKINDLDNFFK